MKARNEYWLTRFVFLRGMGLIYAIGFLVLLNQGPALFGEHGLLPAPLFLERVGGILGSGRFWRLPTLFWLGFSNALLKFAAGAGLAMAIAVILGITNSFLFAALWILYLSFINIGQIFYGYGWEPMVLEAGFLSIFFSNSLGWRPFSPQNSPPPAIPWLLRWMLFRVMFGAGMIKLRGDPCWRDLTCMQYHYETQPIPNPLSFYFHHSPVFFHKLEVAFTHFIEVIVPFGYFGPRKIRTICGILTCFFQFILILSGNLSWLNYLTIIIAIGCFDDSFFRAILGPKLSQKVSISPPRTSRIKKILVTAYVVLVVFLSVNPALNLLSSGQAMNASFEPFQIVNTYGAFGSVSRERMEIIFEGTADSPGSPDAVWRPYEFQCKPGDIDRRPCLVSPYHLRLDWQMWFAAMSDYQHNDWLIHLAIKMLENDKDAMSLLASNPFTDKPPRAVRAELYRYRFADLNSRSWWQREKVGNYLPALSLDNPELKSYMNQAGWTQ